MKKVSRDKHTYLFDARAEPALWVRPGETVMVETWDCRRGIIRKPSDLAEAARWRASVPGMPIAGPICVEGAERGDALAVEILEIRPTEIPGFVSLRPGFGGLTGDVGSFLNLKQEPTVKICTARDGTIRGDGLTLPYRPMIGCIGTAPEFEAISNGSPGRHGGNLDLPDVAPGSTLYLPVSVKGGFLSLGDTHAIQGDGEVGGGAIEMAADVVLRIGLLKGKRPNGPRLETASDIMAVGWGKSLEDTVRMAYRELILWMEADFGVPRWDAYLLGGLLGRIRIGQVVNPLYSVAASFPKAHLAAATKST